MKKRIKIYEFSWEVKFIDVKELPPKTDGVTLYNERIILIRNDLNAITTQCVLRHELTHAILCMQGRWMQKTFSQEEVCEFIAFNLPLIDKLQKEILEDETK